MKRVLLIIMLTVLFSMINVVSLENSYNTENYGVKKCTNFEYKCLKYSYTYEYQCVYYNSEKCSWRKVKFLDKCLIFKKKCIY